MQAERKGFCVKCFKAIDPDRLEFLPECEYCAVCQSENEATRNDEPEEFEFKAYPMRREPRIIVE